VPFAITTTTMDGEIPSVGAAIAVMAAGVPTLV
jgi:hypothetical protein